jgi:sugar O-acyltransferase (sialic acid O-acetyltransferase NeuD family)
MQKCKLIVIGAGGSGKEMLWAALESNSVDAKYDLLGYCDDNRSKKGDTIRGYPVLGSLEEVDAGMDRKPCFICSIGSNEMRARVVRRTLSLGWIPVTIIHPSVTVADGVVIGRGTYVGPQATLCVNANIGEHVIINVGSTIGHDSVIGDFAQVSAGGRVSGGCVLKEGANLGSNAVMAPCKTVGTYATLGACSFAVIDVPDGATAVGIPARVIFRRKSIGGEREETGAP